MEQPEIDLAYPETWPKKNTYWKHTSGRIYEVLGFANIENDPKKNDRYPVTIIYQNVANEHIYTRRLDDWQRSFVPVQSV